jgi:hypothetical protein
MIHRAEPVPIQTGRPRLDADTSPPRNAVSDPPAPFTARFERAKRRGLLVFRPVGKEAMRPLGSRLNQYWQLSTKAAVWQTPSWTGIDVRQAQDNSLSPRGRGPG